MKILRTATTKGKWHVNPGDIVSIVYCKDYYIEKWGKRITIKKKEIPLKTMVIKKAQDFNLATVVEFEDAPELGMKEGYLGAIGVKKD